MATSEKFTLQISSELKNATLLSDWVQVELERAGIPDDTVRDILICVDEAFSNIVYYGYKQQPEGVIRIEISIDISILSVTFTDNAEPYVLPGDKPQLGRALLEKNTPGVGVYIMRQLVDDVRYERAGNANYLTLIKKMI